MTQHRHPPIAIIGMASLFPKAPSLSDYWRNILDATDCISDVPADHSWNPDEHFSDDPAAKDKTWCTRGGFLDKYPFDPVEFGIPPNILESIDTTQLLSLIVARQALIDAGMDPKDTGWDREKVACILGVTGTQEMAVTLGARLFGPVWRKALQRCGVDARVADAVVEDIGSHLPTWTEQSFPGLLGNVVTGRISNRFDLGGTNAVVDAACASSLAAMQYALSELTSYRSDVVLTGGADCLNDTFMFQCFTRTPAFTKKGDATPFDAKSDGILIGEGIAMVACKRLEDAERDGDRIYAVIKGLGSSSDGRFKSIYAPNPDGQAKCLRRAYEMADVEPNTIELIEAHGTGTKAGDVAEISGLKQVYGDITPTDGSPDRWVQIGSVKSQIGHTKSTAGAAGLVKAVLALHHRVLPPTAKVEQPNPKMQFEDSPFFLSPHARPWVRSADHPRRAGVSAFGFGGTNYHCVLEEYGDDTAVQPIEAARGELFAFKGRDASALTGLLDDLAAKAETAPTFAHLSRATLEAFDTPADGEHVLAFAAAPDELQKTIQAARALIQRGPGSRSDVHYGIHSTSDAGKLAFVFPGQGSQYVEMGRDLAIRWPTVRSALDAADEHFRTAGRARLSTVVFPPPYGDDSAQQARLRQTEWAQPAIGAFSKGLFDLLSRFGLEPDVVAGHSYGELSALYAGGVLDADGLFAASRLRGEAMSAGTGDRGTMAAVSGPLAEIETVLKKSGTDVVLANRNHPEQGVISGSRTGIDQAITALEAAGLTAKRISVGAAFHSPLVADAVEPFGKALRDVTFRKARRTVLSCNTGRSIAKRPADVRRKLAEQIAKPVDWVAVVDGLVEQGVTTVVEVGPKGVLSQLVRKCAGDRLRVVSLDRHRHRVDGDIQLKDALAQLLAAGVDVDLTPLLDQNLPPLPPKGRSKATVGLNGANHKFESTKNPPVTPKIEQARQISAQKAAPAPPAPTAPAQTASPAPAPQKTPVPKTAQKPPAPTAKGAHTAKRNPMNDDLSQLLESTRSTLLAFQSTQERTAEVHARFLDAHAEANASFHTLFQTHARLVEIAATGQSSIPAVQHTPRPTVRAALTAPAAPRTPAAPQPSPQLAQAVAAQPKADTSGMQSVMSTEASALVGSFLGKGTKTPATQRLPGLSGAVAVADDMPPLLDARSQAIQARPATPAAPAQPARPAAPAPRAAAPAAPASAGPDTSGIEAAMFESVAEKTGYPLDMLEPAMDLEADLGIDSIKRVEILSSVQEKVPGLPELDNDRLSALRTLAEVVDYLAESMGGSATPGATASAAPVASTPAPAASPANTGASNGALADVQAAMFESVAEKTGYPLDMLEPAMDLEADLGIDSIKRVEILSSVQEKVPSLPELDNDRLSALRTLAEVVDYLAEAAGAFTGSPAPAPAAPAASGGDDAVQAAMFESVAEKTGYPLDMLEPAMDLEADLGIDSIKRVEILSAVQDKVPGLPELDNDRLSALRTLAEVVSYLAEAAGGSASVSTPALVSLQPGSSQVDPPPPAAAPPAALLRKEVRLVPCGPGIPSVPTGRIAVTSDARGHVDTLVKALKARGVDAVRLDVDWGALAEGRFQAPKVDGIVHFACVGARGSNLDERVKGAFLLAKAVGPVGFFATVSTLGGDFGTTRCKEPVMGGLAGLPKTLSHEWDGRFVAIDVDPALTDGLIDGIADAVVSDFASLEIGVQSSGLVRLHNAVVSMPWNDPSVPVQPGELVVVSGGAKGVTASVVVEMAKRYRPDLLLLGRSELDAADPAWARGIPDDGLRKAWMDFARSQGDKPTPKAMDRAVRKVTSAREIRATLEAVRATGSNVQYAACDIRDADSVEAVVARVGKPVAGIVHGAGVLADKLVVDKTPDQFDFVWGTKVEGLDALLSTTDGNLKLAVLFSSVAGRYGNVGQVDYSMANEVLTHTGLQLAQHGVRVKSFDWGPWEAGMVTPALKKAFEARGLTVIPLDGGARFACDELERGGDAVEVVCEGPRPETGSVTRTLTVTAHPWLVDHSIDGRPVVPVAMVLEWFADAARQVYPRSHVASVDDLAVLKGIVLEDGSAELTLSWEPAPSAPGAMALAMQLASTGGSVPRVHYKAVVTLAHEAPVVHRFGGSNGLGKQQFTAETYGPWLFHGPTFQGIDEVVGYSDHGIVAWLKSSTPSALGLGGAAWTTDPLTVDSALQLMLLWVGETQGARALPCRIRRFQQFKPFEGRVACHLEMEGASARGGRFQATFVDEAGEVVARLDAGEYAARP